MKQITEIYRSRMQQACLAAVKKGKSAIAKRKMSRLNKPTKIGED